ncbi:MAG: TIGR00730 family Rossman fold protein [Nitrospirales bacterium]
MDTSTPPLSSLIPPSDAGLLDTIQQLLADSSCNPKIRLLQDMIKTVVKLQHSDVDVLEVKILNQALKELRNGFQVFHPYRQARKVSIFGSARTSQDDSNFQLAAHCGRVLSERGYMVITGAGPGIMWAGHEGAGRENSFGVNIRLPFEQAPNSLIAEDEKLVNLKYFFTRKLLFVKESHATVIFPGGFGTLDEGFEVLTLIQTGKTDPAPVVLLEAPGSNYWEKWMGFVQEHLLRRGLISETDLALFTILHDASEAVEEIDAFYRNYHSIRYVGENLVVRLQYALTPEEIDDVNQEFHDILKGGEFTQSTALTEEYDDVRILDLPRLVFQYNRKDAGRLRQLIDRLNVCEAVNGLPSSLTPVSSS